MGTAERRERERLQRRQQILDAARTLFLEKGYFATKVEDIAARAELAAGTIYLYFDSKDEIFATLCEEGLDILNRLFAEAMAKSGGFRERLTALAAAYLAFYLENGSYFDILSFVGLGFKRVGLPLALESRINAKHDQAIRIAEQVVREGMAAGEIAEADTKETTFAVWGVIDGLIFIHRRSYMDSWGVDLIKVARIATEAMLKGLRPDAPAGTRPVSQLRKNA